MRLNDFSINWILQILHFPTSLFICTNYFTHIFCIWTSFPFMLRIAFLLKCSLHTSLIFFPSYHFIVDGSKDIKLSLNQIIVVSIALLPIYTNSMETYISITNCVFSYIGDGEVLRLSHSIISNNEKIIIAMWTNYLQFIVTVYVKSVEQFNSSEKWF